MLRNFDNRLTADVIQCLRAMGHGDDLVICDTNFPADSVARHTVTGQLIRMDNLTAAEAIDAILSVFPLDSFVDKPADRMEMADKPSEVAPVQAEVQAVIDRREGKSWPMGSIERFAFYDKARSAYAVIVTGETRFYGCFILKKGVIPPKS
jgi:L-fucose mutarotase